LYSRQKTGIYGEFLLWPETLAGIRWALARKESMGFGDLPWLLVTQEGQPFHRRTEGNKNVAQIVANKWGKLNARIVEQYPTFRALPYGTFRDTGSDLMRHLAGGEAASCYIMHGKATDDKLLDLYSNRPFAQVFNSTASVVQRVVCVFVARFCDAIVWRWHCA
jgi:hypothetical protein